MTKNTLLNIGIVLCKFLRVFYVVLFVIITAFFVHYQISPSTYKNVDLDIKMEKSGITLNQHDSYKIGVNGEVPTDSEVFTLQNMEVSSLYFNYVKIVLVMILGFLCVKEFQKVIESVKEIRTFQKRNVSSFRRIGKYLLIIFILESYSSFSFEQGGTSSFQLSFELLILSLLAFIMAEIFKEGNNLLEENELTV